MFSFDELDPSTAVLVYALANLVITSVCPVPLGVFMMLRKPAGAAASSNGGSASAGVKPAGIAADAVDFLLRFASAPWFPLVAALGTAINMFTIIFTGATVIIFLAAILGNRKRAHSHNTPSNKRS